MSFIAYILIVVGIVLLPFGTNFLHSSSKPENWFNSLQIAAQGIMTIFLGLMFVIIGVHILN